MNSSAPNTNATDLAKDLLWTWTPTELTAKEADLRADMLLLRALESGLGQWSAGGETSPPQLSRSQLQRLMDEGRVLADRKSLKSNARIKPHQIIELRVPPPRSMELVPDDRPLQILFEDDHLVVINKPPGLTVHPSPTQMDNTLVHALLHHVKDLSGIGGVLRPGIVHRIDKDTSGAIVVTKTDAAHQALVRVFAKHEIERRYWALCYGSLEDAVTRELRIESLIARNPNDRKKMSMQVSEGRRAVTFVKTLERFLGPDAKARSAPFASLIEARLETGRTHQVRVHLTGSGNSLLGDPVYGTPSEKNNKWLALPESVRECVHALPGQALHARVLAFKHPISGKELRFEAEPFAEFQRLLEVLRSHPSP